MSRFSRPAALAMLAALAGCTVGPNYAGPPGAAPKAAAGGAFVRGGDLSAATAPDLARWWEALADPTLDALEARALAANPNLDMARARVRQARAAFRLERANRSPKLDASAIYAHARIPGLDLGSDQGENQGSNDGTSELNLFNLGVNASWEVDLFGGSRRTIEAARAAAAAQEARLADVQVSLTADVADAYVNIRDRQRRIALAEASLARQSQALALIQQRYAGGTASRLDVERATQQLVSARADVTPVSAELDAYFDALATLTGDEPGAHDALLRQAAPLPLPPAAVAVGDPAALLRRRPDIRAAERTLAADTARIGQAEAARFPRLSFLGILGIGGSRASDLSRLDDFLALLAPQLSWSFLDFGRNQARVAQANAVRDEAAAQYRATVLTALRDAEDSLSRFRNARGVVGVLARALASASTTEQLTQQRYEAGTTTLADLLDTQRRRLDAEQALVQAEARLTLSFVAVQKALGLGWSDAEANANAEKVDQVRIR